MYAASVSENKIPFCREIHTELNSKIILKIGRGLEKLCEKLEKSFLTHIVIRNASIIFGTDCN